MQLIDCVVTVMSNILDERLVLALHKVSDVVLASQSFSPIIAQAHTTIENQKKCFVCCVIFVRTGLSTSRIGHSCRQELPPLSFPKYPQATESPLS